MKCLFTSLLIIITYLFSFGQEFNEVVKLDIFGNPSNSQNQMYINMMNRSNELKKDLETSLYPEWQAAEVMGKNEVAFAIDSINYNYSTDQFYFSHHNNLYYLNSEKVKTVNIDSDMFSIYRFQTKKDIKKGYLQVLVDGDFPLLKRTYLKKMVVNDHPMKLPQANRTVLEKTSDLYYLNKKTRLAEKLPKSKKKFINLFKKRQAKLIRFAEEQKISTNDEIDVIRFFQYNKTINSEQNQ